MRSPRSSGRFADRAGVPAADIGVLGLASQVDGLVAVDADGEPLAPAIIWLDRRATAQARALGDAVDPAEIRRLTGLNLDASHVAPKMLWLRDDPAHHLRARCRTPPPRQRARRVADRRAGRRPRERLLDAALRHHDPRLVATRCSRPPGSTPRGWARSPPAADVVGALRDGPAAALGLTTATRVVVGTGDEHGASLGAGGIRPGIVIDITGTAEPVCVAATTPIIDETGLVETHAHADPRVWLVENPGFVSGGSVAWFTDAMGGGHAPAQLDAEAAAGTRPGADGVTFLPTLSGATAPRWNDLARGVYAGLSLNHGRAHLYRALLEGCTFALRDIVDRLDAMGLAGDEIRVVGGGARSPLWLQMKADVTGRTVRVMASDESTALGAAMLAGVGAGTFAGLDEAVERLAVLEPAAYEPDPDHGAAYDDAYGRYRALFDAVEPGFAAYAAVPRPAAPA